ncbi:MAG: hypothetical protein ACRDPC_11790 [Solirubrobacteraceae bacterium]
MLRGRLADRRRTAQSVDLHNRLYGRVGVIPAGYRDASAAQRATAVVAEAGVLTADLLVYAATEHVDRPRSARKRDRERLMAGFAQPARLEAAAVFAAHGIVARERELAEDATWHGLHRLIAELLAEHFPLDDRQRDTLAHGLKAEDLGLWSLEVVYSAAVLDALLGGSGSGELALFDDWAANAYVDQGALAGVWQRGGERYLALLGDGLIVGVAGSDELIAELPDDDYVAVPSEQLRPVIDELADATVLAVEDQLDQPLLQALSLGMPLIAQRRDFSNEAWTVGQTAARLGYLARRVEFERFAAAREPDDELLALYNRERERTTGQAPLDTAAEFAARLADVDPPDPNPGDPSPLWLIPGIGGHARTLLAMQLLAAVGEVGPNGERQLPVDLPEGALLKAWKYGYFVGALEDSGALT